VIEHEAAWSISAHPAAVREIRHSVTRFAERAGFADSALDDVRSCVSEAVTNAVVHAFRGDRAAGTIIVCATIDADELRIVVSDDGIGFRPRADSPGLGLGLPTIAALTDTMSVAAAPTGGTEICMAFTRDTPGADRTAEPARSMPR
jgi:serine/threonine-protein kinase RsbW/stage II sporulation protein AB (anti-sigma F factor)